MPRLVLQHQDGPEGFRFRVLRPEPFKDSPPAEAPSPAGFGVDGRAEIGLLGELRW